MFLYGWRDVYLFLMPVSVSQNDLINFSQAITLLVSVSLIGIIIGLLLFRYALKLWPLMTYSINCYFLAVGIFFALMSGYILWKVVSREDIQNSLLQSNGEYVAIVIGLTIFYFFLNISISRWALKNLKRPYSP